VRGIAQDLDIVPVISAVALSGVGGKFTGSKPGGSLTMFSRVFMGERMMAAVRASDTAGSGPCGNASIETFKHESAVLEGCNRDLPSVFLGVRTSGGDDMTRIVGWSGGVSRLRAESEGPEADGFVGGHNPSGEHQLGHVAQAQTEAVIEPYAMAKESRREAISLVERWPGRRMGHGRIGADADVLTMPPHESTSEPVDRFFRSTAVRLQ
jgi:hypothetical protein